jgi:hypothetical protein
VSLFCLFLGKVLLFEFLKEIRKCMRNITAITYSLLYKSGTPNSLWFTLFLQQCYNNVLLELCMHAEMDANMHKSVVGM